jgi:hypothetical protein
MGMDDVTFTLAQGEYEILLIMMGYAANAAFRNREGSLGCMFIRVANKVNENNPNWVPYQMPSETVH